MDQADEFPYFFNRGRTVWIEEPIVSYLHKSCWENMLKESPDKFHGLELHRLPFLLVTIFIGKLNGIIFNASDAIVGDGNTKHIPCKVAQGVFSFSHGLSIDNPFLFPNVRIDFIQQLSLFHGISELGFEDDCQGFCVNKEILP